jgi:hypothetical protein
MSALSSNPANRQIRLQLFELAFLDLSIFQSRGHHRDSGAPEYVLVPQKRE